MDNYIARESLRDKYMPLMIKALPAANGDSIIIKFGEKNNFKNIVIDGGRGLGCYRDLNIFLKGLEKGKDYIELIIVTHIDDDHINGILKIVQDGSISKDIVKDVWFNSGTLISGIFNDGEVDTSRVIPLELLGTTDMSVKQGISLETHLETLGIWSKRIIKSIDSYNCSGAVIKVLSPNLKALSELNNKWEYEVNKNTDMASISDYSISIEDLINKKFVEDTSIPNMSSIGLIFEYDDKCIMMFGDAHPSIIVESLKLMGYSSNNKIKVDILKVSHHGSKFNTSDELLELIECKEFIISTDGSQHGLPHKECLARILKHSGKGTKFYFNYNLVSRIFSKDEIERFEIKYRCLAQDEYITVGE